MLGGTFLVATPAAALGATYYVSPSGSDSSSGMSSSTPWKTIAKVNATTLTAGQSVAFQGGQTFAGEIDPKGSGASGSPIIYDSYGSGMAIISGHPATDPTGVSYVTYANLILDGGNAGDCVDDYSGAAATHVTFDGDEIRNCFNGFNQSRGSDANWTIENSYIHNTSDSGIIVTGPNHGPNGGGFVIANDKIENTGTQNPITAGYDSHGIYADSRGIRILSNDIGNFQTDGVTVRYRDAVIEGNTIHDGTRSSCCSAGIAYYNYDATETAGQGTSVVAYNRIWNSPYGMEIAAGANNGALAGPENWRIYGNTFAGSRPASGRSAYGISYASANVGTALTIENNIFTGSFSGGGLSLGRRPPAYIENYNDWNSTGGPGDGARGTNDITNAPGIAAPPSFTPAPASPVVSTGTARINGVTFTKGCMGAMFSYCRTAPNMGAGGSVSAAPTATRRSGHPVRVGNCRVRADSLC